MKIKGPLIVLAPSSGLGRVFTWPFVFVKFTEVDILTEVVYAAACFYSDFLPSNFPCAVELEWHLAVLESG